MKRIIICFSLIVTIFIFSGCKNKKDNVNPKVENKKDNITQKVIENKEGSDEMSISIIINNNNYVLNLENNETTREFVKLLPKEYVMNELNGNEKYVYLDSNLPTNSFIPKEINAGDVYLYGNDCLVVFYKSFITSYSYTKIGHIDNLPDLGNKEIIIGFKL